MDWYIWYKILLYWLTILNTYAFAKRWIGDPYSGKKRFIANYPPPKKKKKKKEENQQIC